MTARRHLFIGVAARDEAHDLLLAGGQPVEFVAGGRRLSRDRAERVEHEPREPRREHRVAAGGGMHGTTHLDARRPLRDVAAGARADHADDVFRGIRHTEREEPRGDARRRTDDLLAARGVVPRAARQMHIEQYDVGPGLGDDRDRGRHVGGLADHDDGLVEVAAQPRPEDRMVVDDHDPDGLSHGRLRSSAWGRVLQVHLGAVGTGAQVRDAAGESIDVSEVPGAVSSSMPNGATRVVATIPASVDEGEEITDQTLVIDQQSGWIEILQWQPEDAQ